MSDKINPPYYNKSIETTDYILAHDLGYLEGNIIKYVTRYKEKNGIEDLHKAEWYLAKLIKQGTEDLAKLPDVPQEEVYIPQWDRTILVQGISKATQIKLGRLINADETDAFDYQKELLKVSVVAPPLDDDAINMIYEKDSTIVDQIFVALNDINGIGGSGDLADQF